MLTNPARYCLRVQGQLGPEWSEWFDGMTITHDETNETTLSGQVRDQAALYGILYKIQALGLPLLAVNRIAAGGETGESQETSPGVKAEQMHHEGLHQEEGYP